MMKSTTLIILFVILLSLFFGVLFNVFPKQLGYFLVKSNEYAVYNNENQNIECNIYKYNKGNHLILHFNEINRIYTIDLNNNLIGINDFGYGFNTFFKNTFLYLNPNAKMFTPLNIGTHSLDNDYKIVLMLEEDTIYFSTNNDLKIYGKKIILNKQ